MDKLKYLWHFSLKSLKRHWGRSLFISLSVSLAVIIAVWVAAFFDGLNTQVEESVVNTNIGYYQVQTPSYFQTTDSTEPLIWTKEIEEELKKLGAISYSPELVLDSNLTTPEGSATLIALGVLPEYHQKMLSLKIQGEFVSQSDEKDVVIGAELAKIFKFHLGDEFVLNYQDQKGELRSELLRIKGIYQYGGSLFEKKYIYLHQKTWKSIFLSEPSQDELFNRIVVMTPSLKEEKTWRKSFQALKLRTWKDLNPEMAVVLDFHDGMINFFFVIIGVTILMTILTPVRMLWEERVSELKMMKIIGLSKKDFWKLGMVESFLMMSAALVVSSLSLAFILGIQSKTGIDFRFLNDGVSVERAGIKLPGIIFPQLYLKHLVQTFCFVFFVLGGSYAWSLYKTHQKIEGER